MARHAHIGRLTERITFQRYTLTPDGGGGFERSDEPADIGPSPKSWAEVIDKGGREQFEDGQTDAVASVVFRIRYRSDILESDVILYKGALYQIRHIPREGSRHRFIYITTDRGVPA